MSVDRSLLFSLLAHELTRREQRRIERLNSQVEFRQKAQLPLNANQRSDLLELIDGRYDHHSIVIISQLPVNNWYEMIGESTHADAILDRLVHRSIKMELQGESMRKVKKPMTNGDQ